jgi:nucleoside-diphosphate-sugar epimerase
MTREQAPVDALRAALRHDDRVVVTGASGWMGRSIIEELLTADPTLKDGRLLALGSHPRPVTLLDERVIEIRDWDLTEVTDWSPTVAIHLACLTIDRLTGLADDTARAEYIATNERLAQMGRDLIGVQALRSFLFASSGAATTAEAGPASSAHPYAVAKMREEQTYRAAGLERGLPVLGARLWSVSGPHCQRPRSYAFSDMIVQSLSTGRITIHATGAVTRRYVDAGEFLAACLAVNLGGRSGIIDSAGPLVELRELGAKMCEVLGGEVASTVPDPDAPVNSYVADPAGMAELAESLNIAFTDLHGQIRRTAAGFAK